MTHDHDYAVMRRNETRYYAPSPVEQWLQMGYGTNPAAPVIAYAPNTPDTTTLMETYLMEQIEANMGAAGAMAARMQGYETEEEVEQLHLNSPIAAAIIFKEGGTNASALGLSADMSEVHYTIRMAEDLPQSTRSWLTSVIFPARLGKRWCTLACMYILCVVNARVCAALGVAKEPPGRFAAATYAQACRVTPS